jgi:hypothetical protein
MRDRRIIHEFTDEGIQAIIRTLSTSCLALASCRSLDNGVKLTPYRHHRTGEYCSVVGVKDANRRYVECLKYSVCTVVPWPMAYSSRPNAFPTPDVYFIDSPSFCIRMSHAPYFSGNNFYTSSYIMPSH